MGAPGTGDKGYQVSWNDELQIARIDWAPGACCDLATAQQVDRDVQHLGRGKVRLLVDLRPNASIDREGRHFFINLHAHYLAVALLAGSPATRMLANFFLGMKRGTIPVRLFTAEDEAIDWIRSVA
ncbi:STAS/SEC14 domain-containing protein [Nocardioides sp.]|uniref:STAS/SEC14 domain-containing protein n=1 Tax=Nocardioides sp. TaxID=35761 RepID=UPI002ED7F7D0